MNIGRLMNGPDDKGYDPENWVENAIASEASEAVTWLEQINNAAAHDDGQYGDAARTVLGSSASIVAKRHGI